MAQHAFVVLPVILQQLEVSVVEGSGQLHRVVVVDLAVAVELVLRPVALVGQLPALVVQLAEPVHFVVLPLALVIASVLVVELASAVAHIVALEALVPAACLVLLHDVFLLVGLLGFCGVFGGVFISDFDDGGVELVFGWRALRRVWTCFLDVLFLGNYNGLLLLGDFDYRLVSLLWLLLGLDRAVCVGFYVLVADLLRFRSFVDGLIIGETFFVGRQRVECEVIGQIVYTFRRDFWNFRKDDRKWLLFDEAVKIAR